MAQESIGFAKSIDKFDKNTLWFSEINQIFEELKQKFEEKKKDQKIRFIIIYIF